MYYLYLCTLSRHVSVIYCSLDRNLTYTKVMETEIWNHFTSSIATLESPKTLKRIFHQRKQLLSHHQSLLIVRHPFNRLVSAFRDKLEQVQDRVRGDNPESDYFYRKYGSQIVEDFRSKAVAKFGSDFFKEENQFGAILPIPKGKRTKVF